MVLKSRVRAGPPLVRRLADSPRTCGSQSCHFAGNEPDRRVLVLMRTFSGRRECQVVREYELSRVPGLVQEHRDHRGALHPRKHLGLEQNVKTKGLTAIRDQRYS